MTCDGCGAWSEAELPMVHARTPLGYIVLRAHEDCEAAALAGYREQPVRRWRPKRTLSEQIAMMKPHLGRKASEERA